MTRPVAQLITGARALSIRHGGSAMSESWAKIMLETFISDLPARSVVMHGDCDDSPDAWASEIARSYGVRVVAFRTDGWRYLDGERTERWYTGTERFSSRFPLLRNTYMAEQLVKAHGAGWQARALALFAPWAKTQGTDHCARACRALNLPVIYQSAPVAYRGEGFGSKGPSHANRRGSRPL